MEIKTHEMNDIRVVDLIGNLDTSTSPEAESSINQLLDDGTKKMVINLEKIDYLSSSGLRVFLGAAKRMMATGGKVALCNPNNLVMEILQHSGFDSIIDIKATLDEAVESM
jgi:anti-sigma B factor antagonist